MKIEEFNQLTEIEKEEVVWDNGFFISTNYVDDFVYDVYKVEAFYAQISYKLNDVKGLSIHASPSLSQLSAIYTYK